jgi:hypothetical protein
MAVLVQLTVTPATQLNRPGESGDSDPWEGWSHVRDHLVAVSA